MVLAPLAVVTLVLVGRVLDRTTGQPLPHVRVAVAGGPHAASDAEGRFVLRGLHGRRIVVTLESDDVPPQHVGVTLASRGTTTHDVRACSTTLDYSCGAPAPTGTDAAPNSAG